ncbi:DMT family transporter [Halosimplex pelagicum]|uniref:DMT family transporter n=1 Tax=Halosimplex pelagicum TaxID=869886 RepID=A0A7D5TBT6_9EURY|nr:DMT family transporter [Halosimplex pelagicum]QLH81575.1 DMT family transporter [Halosimplex pelagicum]
MTSQQLVGAAFAVLAAAAFAAQSLAVRVGTRTHTVSAVIAVVFGVNLLVLVPVAGVAAYPDYGLTPRAAGAFAVAGLLGSLLARVFYFVGIERLGASRAEPLRALVPLFALGLAVAFLGEAVTPVLLAGVALLVAGGAVVAVDSRAAPVTDTGRALWVALAFPVTAALCLGIDPVFTKVGFAEGTPALVAVTVRVFAATAGFGLYLAWRALREGRAVSVGVDRWLVGAGVANTVYLLAYYQALARTPVTVVTPLLSASTLFVVAGAALFLRGDEHVTRRTAAAALLVVVGVVLVVGG